MDEPCPFLEPTSNNPPSQIRRKIQKEIPKRNQLEGEGEGEDIIKIILCLVEEVVTKHLVK